MAGNPTNSSAPSDITLNTSSMSFGETRINVVNTSYTWTIINFSACEKATESLLSPMFTVGLNKSCKWQILLYPYGNTKENENLLSIFLQPAWADKTIVFTTKSVFYIIDSKKNKTNCMCAGFKKYGNHNMFGFGISRFLSRDDLCKQKQELLPNDSLTLLVEVTVVEDTVNIAGANNTPNIPECRFLENLSDLYNSKKYSDVIFIIGDRRFTAHRAILAARSRVFSTMFENKMAVSQPAIVVRITEIDAVTFEAMLRFLYSNKTNNLKNMASKLLVAANKYELERLKGLCEEALCNDLTTLNVVDQLILADTHGAAHLKTRAIEFFGAHIEAVMETAKYQSLHVTHPNLLDETVKTLFSMRKTTDGS